MRNILVKCQLPEALQKKYVLRRKPPGKLVEPPRNAGEWVMHYLENSKRKEKLERKK